MSNETEPKYCTPKEALDAIAGDRPLDAVLGNPKFGELPGGVEIGTAPWKPLDIPELGISFQRFHSAEYEMYVAAWRDGENSSHVYALAVERVGTEWCAVGTNDGHEVFSVTCASRYLTQRLGLAAMRAYLIRGHRKTWRKARRLAEDGSPHPEPLSPEEELADTVARKKEEEAAQ